MDELERQRELFERAMEDASRNVIMSAENFNDLNKSTSKYTKSLDKLEKFTNTYGRQITQIGRDFDQNKGKMSAFGGITDLAGDALGELGVAGRLAGKALSAIAGMTFEEVDRTMENFQKMGSVGAVGAEGMTEFRIGAHAARLTMDQFANIISKNASALALATGNTLDGARALSQVTEAAGETGLRRQLMNLGVGIEEQTDFFADYFAQVRRLGLQQNRDYRSQSGAVGTYVKQLILLSRLTGESIDSAKAQMEAQNRSARFQGAMQELAATQGAEYANRVAVEVAALGNKLGPAGTAMLMDIFSGPNTQAAKDFLVTFGSEGQAAIDRVKSGAADLGELSEMIVRSGMAQRERFGGPGQLGLLGETGVIDATVSALLSVPQATELTREALQKQVDAINAGAGGADKLTENLNKAAEASQDAAVNLESARDIFLNIGSTVLPAFSGAVEGATDMLKDLVHGVGGSIKKRAKGGSVSAGSAYLVGEQGPELMIPQVAGEVFTNKNTNAILQQYQSNMDVIKNGMQMFQTAFANQNVLSQRPGPIETSRGTSFDVRGEYDIEGYKLSGVAGSTILDTAGNIVKHILPTFVEGLSSTLFADNTRSVKYQAGSLSLEGILNQQNELLKTITSYTIGDNQTRVVKDLVNRLETTSTKGYSARPAYDPLIDDSTFTRSFDKGGIASGPKSGYTAMLHGTEAVVPLPDGKNIPVQNTNASMKTDEQLKLMGQQISRLDSLISLMQSQNDTSKKMLRATTA